MSANQSTGKAHAGARFGRSAVAGVYGVVCVPTGETYVGATTNLAYRRTAHFSKLRCGAHHCRKLQSRFCEHGESAFKWVMFQDVRQEDDGPDLQDLLSDAEQEWMGRHEPDAMLNSTRQKFPRHVRRGDEGTPRLQRSLLADLRERAKIERRTTENALARAVLYYLRHAPIAKA